MRKDVDNASTPSKDNGDAWKYLTTGENETGIQCIRVKDAAKHPTFHIVEHQNKS